MKELIYLQRGKHALKIGIYTHERSFMCYETDTESDVISITSFSITCCTEQTDIPYRTAEHSFIHSVFSLTTGPKPPPK